MEMMKLGPSSGDTWGTNWEELCSDRISHKFVSFDDRGLTSIQFGYVKNGALFLSKKHGSSNIISTRIVRFLTNLIKACLLVSNFCLNSLEQKSAGEAEPCV